MRALSRAPFADRPAQRQRETTLLFRDDSDLELVRFRGDCNPLYRQLLAVRSGGQSRSVAPQASCDSFSDHYLAIASGEPVGCLTVTRGSAGPLDCEEFYPAELIERYRSVATSACRLRVVPNSRPSLMPIIIREAWRDQVAHGSRLDIVNVTSRIVRIHQRFFGYQLIPGYSFIHPRLHTPSEVLYLPADPMNQGRLASLFQDVDDPLYGHQIQCLLRTTVTQTRPRKGAA